MAQENNHPGRDHHCHRVCPTRDCGCGGYHGQLFFTVAFSYYLLAGYFLGLRQALSELKMLEGHASEHREVLAGYTIALLDQYLLIVLCATLITYCLYTFSAHPSGNNYTMMLTIPFVLYGLFRYLYIMQNTDLAAAPEEALLKDRPLQLVVILWAMAVVIVIYLIH